MRKGNPCQASIALLETPVADMCAEEGRECLVINKVITMSPYHISMILYYQ